MRPPDRFVGACCLLVALVAATWGRGPADAPARAEDGRAAVEVTAGEPREADPRSTSTTAAPSTTSTTARAATSSTTTTTTGPAPATTAAASRQADEALAKEALLVAADLPAGFVAVRDAPAGDADGNGPFERCLGSDAATLTAAVRARARSGEYGRSGAGTVSSSSAVLDTPASATQVLDTLATPSAQGCFEGLINARLARNPNLSEEARGTLSPVPAGGYGDQSTGFRFEVELPAEDVEDEPSGERVSYVADFIFARKGRVLVLVEFGNLRRPFPAADQKTVITNLLRRI